MLRLDVPRRATINESPQLTRLVGDAEREKGPVEFDCSKTEAWGPFGIALVASSLVMRSRAGRETRLIEPSDVDHLSVLEETGLLEVLRGETTASNRGYVQSIPITPQQSVSEIASALASPLEHVVAVAPAVVRPCLEALLDNLFEWSQSPIGGFALVRWHKKTRQARFALVDRGLGIPAVLRRGHVGDLIRSSDVDVIEAAFLDSNATSRQTGAQGLGLKRLRERVLAHKGKLTVLSLGAKMIWAGERVTKASTPAMRGTAIEIEMSVHASGSSGPSAQQAIVD
jgi:hypothetical protein